jgi:hypothetical protein
MSGSPSFFLRTICGNIQNRLTKEQIYTFYHQKIADKQEKDFRALALVFKLIDDNIRDLNVFTEDVIELRIIQEKTQLLTQLIKSINDAKFSEDAKFLDAVRTVFDYRQVE